MSQAVSSVGINCVGSKRSGFGPFLQTINAAGRRLAVAVDYDDFGAAHECKELWSDIMTVGMLTNTDFNAPQNHKRSLSTVAMESVVRHAALDSSYDDFLRIAKLNPHIDYWCWLNEISGIWDQQADFYINLLPRMKSDGLRLAMFSTASGNPPLPSEDGGASYDQIVRACKFSIDNGYDSILAMHEYQSGGTIGRYKNLTRYLRERGALLPVVITEYGFETFPNVTDFMAMIRANDPVYMPDPNVIGCGTWVLGGGGWGGSNYQAALPELGEYIATVEGEEPVPVSDEWEVDDVMIDGVSIGAQANFDIAMNADHAVMVVAKKKIVNHTLTVAVAPSDAEAHVTVTPNSGQYPHGAILEMTVTFQ